ncbi:uncharacterized protein LOC110721144 [Chenopodium quinoa]|uniref:uncharacterized protein LOC110721144 n=1 Tax=Chenopodium quinoa TaxID=63459 RepID=UPI000B77452C|nr:uncharacterized protein LOC110721144 [Chenopodium quinoa]
MDHVTKKMLGTFFIDGPGGTGKTFLYNALYAEIILMNKIVFPTATSGIAASNIPSGRTTHSWFKIPLDPLESRACSVPKQGSLAALLRETTLIIWDEASMAKKKNVESIGMLLRDICDPQLLLGGKIVVFGEDFRQVLPVVPKRTQREAVAASLVSSALWPLLTKFRLIENIQARHDPVYVAFLLALGNGEIQDSENALIQLPAEIVEPCDSATPQDMHLS